MDDIRRTICADPTLAALDLRLQSLHNQVRRGLATLPSRDELERLQAGWIGQRDQACAATDGRAACLAGQYRAQIDRLGTWTPSARP